MLEARAAKSSSQPNESLYQIEDTVSSTVLRAMQAQERARQLIQQSSRLREQYQTLRRRQRAFEASFRMEFNESAI
jgi:hypothetical protein